MAFLNEIFHLTAAGEINVQNAFLRDIFICMLAAPLLARLPDNALALVLAATLAWSIDGWQLFILLRPQILLFFLIGIIAFRYRLDRLARRARMLPLVIALAELGAGKCWLSVVGRHYESKPAETLVAIDNVLRLVAAIQVCKVTD